MLHVCLSVSLRNVVAGETFHQAACRGLQEELGITAEVPQQPLGPVHKRTLVIPGLYIDNELVVSYRVDGFDGQVCVLFLGMGHVQKWYVPAA